VRLDVDVEQLADGTLRAQGSLPILMTDYDYLKDSLEGYKAIGASAGMRRSYTHTLFFPSVTTSFC